MTRTMLTTASGRHVDLLAPRVEDVDFKDIAEHLAKENRYNGATRGCTYSVAEHVCRGTDAIFEATGMPEVAAAFLLHDAHEAYTKDDTTPKKRAIAALAERRFGVLASQILDAFAELVNAWDVAIYGAAGIPWPLDPPVAHAVHRYDRMMLATEWRDLMRCPAPFEFEVEPLQHIEIIPWGWKKAEIEFLRRCRRYLPAFADEEAHAFAKLMGTG